MQKTANIPSLLIQANIQSQQSRQNETTPTTDNNIVNTHETGVEREDSSSSLLLLLLLLSLWIFLLIKGYVVPLRAQGLGSRMSECAIKSLENRSFKMDLYKSDVLLLL